MGYVQAASGGSSTLNGAINVTLAANTSATNTLIASFTSAANTTNATISGVTLGGGADNWASAETAYGGSATNAAFWIDQNCAGGKSAIVVSLTGQSGSVPANAAVVIEWNGAATSGGVDKKNSANGTSSTASSGSTGTLSQASEVAFGCIGATVSFTDPGSPWNEIGQISVSDITLATGYQQVSATTALTYSGTLSPSSGWGACIITLELVLPVVVNLPLATTTDNAYPLTSVYPQVFTVGTIITGRTPAVCIVRGNSSNPVPTLIRVIDPANTLYIGEDASIQPSDQQVIPLTPGQFITFSGKRDVYGIAASGQTVLIDAGEHITMVYGG